MYRLAETLTYCKHLDLVQFAEIMDKIGHYVGNQRKNSEGQ